MKKKTFHKRMLAAAFAGGLACLAGNAADGASLGTNLVVNSDFENVDTNVGGAFGSVLILDWQGTGNGGFAYNYAQNYDNRNAGVVPPGNDGTSATDYYFTGGNGGDGQPIWQDIDVSTGDTATAIASGKGQYDVSAYFSSYLTQGDQGTLTTRFFDSGDVELDAVTIVDSDLSQWAQVAASGGIPIGTTRVRIESQGIAAAGAPDGYVDNVDFQITESAFPLLATLEVNTTVGTMRILNGTASGLDIDFYEILSGGGSLDPVGWNSFDDQDLDLIGPNPGESWLEGGGSDTELLTEGFLLGTSSIPTGESRSMGGGYDESVDAQDLVFRYGLPGGALVGGIVSYVQGVPCDFEPDGDCDVDDLDALTLVGNLTTGVAVPPADGKFDLTSDSNVNTADLNQWLSDAATVNGHASPYIPGDNDLDRDVDITDFNVLATAFDPGGINSATNKWSVGDGDGDGDVDITDFNVLATNFSPGGYDGATAAAVADADPGQVDLIVDVETGEVTLDGNSAAISGLQVFSAGNSLLATDFTADVLQFVISTNTSTYAEGAFANMGVDGLISLGMMYDALVDARDVTFEYTMIGQPTVQGRVHYIPEPASLVLMGMGGMLVLRRRR